MSMHDIDGIKRESKAERARKEQARRQSTQHARAERRTASNGSLTDQEAFDAFADANVSERNPNGLLRRLAANDLPNKARARLKEHANPAPVQIPKRQEIDLENTHAGAGVDRTKEQRPRAQTRAEPSIRRVSLAGSYGMPQAS